MVNSCEADCSAQVRFSKASSLGKNRVGNKRPAQGVLETLLPHPKPAVSASPPDTACAKEDQPQQETKKTTHIRGHSAKPKSKESFTSVSMEVEFSKGLDNRHGLI